MNLLQVGPESLGHRITTESLSFGGSTTVSTDVANAALLCAIGVKSNVVKKQLSPEVWKPALAVIQRQVQEAIESVRVSPTS